RFVAGELSPALQDHAGATMAPILEKEHGRMRWDRTAREIHDHARAMSSWPGAFTFHAGERVKVHRTRVLDESSERAPAGTIVRADASGVEVACARGVLALEELQLEGKRRMSAAELVAGHRWHVGEVLGAEGTK